MPSLTILASRSSGRERVRAEKSSKRLISSFKGRDDDGEGLCLGVALKKAHTDNGAGFFCDEECPTFSYGRRGLGTSVHQFIFIPNFCLRSNDNRVICLFHSKLRRFLPFHDVALGITTATKRDEKLHELSVKVGPYLET